MSFWKYRYQHTRMDSETVKIQSKDGYEMAIEKATLCESSDYFAGLFASGMRETFTEEVQLPMVSKQALLNIKTFLDEGRVHLRLNSRKSLNNTLSAVNYLQMNTYLNAIERYCQERLQLSNCWNLKEVANIYSLDCLTKIAWSKLLREFNSYSKTKCFFSLTFDQLSELLEDDNLFALSEHDIFSAALSWLSHKNSRLKLSEDVLDLIRFDIMPEEQLEACLNEIVIKKSKFGQNVDGIIEKIAHSREILAKNQFITRSLLNFRCSEKILVATGGFQPHEKSSHSFELVSLSDLASFLNCDSAVNNNLFHRSRRVRLPAKVCEHCQCVLNGSVFILGGQSTYTEHGCTTHNKVYRYTIHLNSWTEVASMQVCRSLFYVGELGGCLYAVGGWTAPDKVTKTVEKFDPNLGTWKYVASMPIGLHEHAGCIHNESIFITGGFKGPYRGHIDKTWRYNPARDSWSKKASMCRSRSYHIMVEHAGRIIVAGGVQYIPMQHDPEDGSFIDLQDCEMYNPEVDQWTLVNNSRIPFSMSCASYFSSGNTLFCFAGHSFENNEDHRMIQALNMDTMEWKSKQLKKQKILYFACCLADIPQNILHKSFKMVLK